MISGTAKETAALALARIAGGTPGANVRNRILGAVRERALAERRELVAAGKLAGSSALPYAVPLAVDMVDDRGWRALGVKAKLEGTPDADAHCLTAPAQRALNDTSTGAHSLWFNAEGHAFLSFEHEEDATLFRLAL